MSIVFADSAPASTLTDRVQAGQLHRLARGIYTDELDDAPERVVHRYWPEITGRLFRSAVVTDRSARRGGPSEDGYLFVASQRQAVTRLPGLTIVSRRGAVPLPGDVELPGSVHLAGRARAWLENTRSSRRVQQRPPRTLTDDELADWVATSRRLDGAEALAAWREEAHQLAPRLGVKLTDLGRLDDLIGASLGTRSVATGSEALAARQVGRPLDETRIDRFDVLVDQLLDQPLTVLPDLPEHRSRRRELPFFEAYFSNFIEGTEFTVDEAHEIVDSGAVPGERPADGHDVLGTYRLLADEERLRRRPSTAAELIEQLREWHAEIMGGRPEAGPGRFKQRQNRAGGTVFVVPDLVEGTLLAAWDRAHRLHTPLQRAIFWLYTISEVHPFEDGNGRLARAVMSAELVAGGDVRVIVPTVSRDDYLNGLRLLSRQDRPEQLMAVIDQLHRFTDRLDLSTVESGRANLEQANAFLDAREAERTGLRLELPGRRAAGPPEAS